MKTARQIQIETAKELQRNPAQYAPFLIRLRREAIKEIKRLVWDARPRALLDTKTKDYGLKVTAVPTLTDEEHGKIKSLIEMFEITDEELR